MKKLLNILVPGVILGLFFISCMPIQKKLEEIHGRTMGTTYSIKYFSSSKSTPVNSSVKQKVENALELINNQMSTYLKSSELSKFNRLKSLEWIVISKNLFDVLKKAKEISKKTKGSFDVTVGPVVNLWGFGPIGKRKKPDNMKIYRAKQKVGYNKFHLKSENKKYFLKKDINDLYLDLSAIAKGFGVDYVAMVLEKLKIKDYMVEVGGEIKISGKKQGKLWKIAIEAPSSKASSKLLEITDYSMATSGNYRNYFTEDGKHYSHTINPQTGRPVGHTLASVTVLSKESCMDADALATSLMVRGHIRGLEFVNINNIPAYFIFEKKGVFIVKQSMAFKKIFVR